jgi:enoyl-CoA hydratase/carnithine racemase
MSSGVEVVRAGRITTVILHGEKSVNVMGSALVAELARVLEDLERDPRPGVVVLTGPRGGSFQGGVDIAEMARFGPDTARSFITLLHRACHALRRLPVPSIARIEGYCLGGGMELAAACDLRIGAAGSRYGMPEVQVGLPSVIEARLLPTLIGWGKTRELVYRGHLIGAEEAQRIGFLQGLGTTDEMEVMLQEWMEDILRAEPGAIRAQKRLIEDWVETPPAAGIEASIDVFAETFERGMANSRLAAFLQRKRAPGTSGSGSAN